MVTKRSGVTQNRMLSNTAQMKYRPLLETGRSTAKGTKLLSTPATIPEIFMKVMLHFCKRVLYTDTKIRVMSYAILLFLVSLITDYMPLPKSYFSNTQNVFNQVFVKFSWGWTFSLVAIFVLLTASVYCCGDKKHIGRHYLRLLIATIIWYVWTTLFATIEEITGKCMYSSPGNPTDVVFSKGRRSCLKSNGKWTSFDISGHSFLLIYCVFFIIEETKPIIGWDIIADHIRDEDHKRSVSSSSEGDNDKRETPLSSLTAEEFDSVKQFYNRHSLLTKVCLLLLTVLVLIWDLMLLMTACYFHIMIEKVMGGIIALCMWQLTYGWLYKINGSLSPGLPGHGKFRYSNLKFGPTTRSVPVKSKSSKDPEVPKFMGMPLNALKSKESSEGVRSSTTLVK